MMNKYLSMIRRGIIQMFFMSTKEGGMARLDIYEDSSWKCVHPVLFDPQKDDDISSGQNATEEILLINQ